MSNKHAISEKPQVPGYDLGCRGSVKDHGRRDACNSCNASWNASAGIDQLRELLRGTDTGHAHTSHLNDPMGPCVDAGRFRIRDDNAVVIGQDVLEG